MINTFAAAPMSVFGYGARKQLIPLLKREDVKKALIVTDKVLNEIGIVSKITEVLDEAEIKYSIYKDVTPNPTIENVEDGSKMYGEENCDFIVAIGGGSANDCAKAINVLISNGGNIRDYQGGNKSKNKGKLLVAVNTTAGTASEISRAYLISDEKEKRKLIFKDDYAMPSIAVNDTELMMGLPKSITAQTGMDALTHAIEGLVSKNSSVLTNILAIKAIELIYNSLPIVVEDLNNVEARDAMAYGQYIAGLSFGNAGLGMVHAMAHQLGATYHLPHGLCNAVLLPEVMKFNKEACIKDFALIADTIKPVEAINMSDEEKASFAVSLIQELSKKVGTAVPLTEMGVMEEDFNILAEKSLQDGCIFTSPVMPTKEEIINIFKILM
ncbi:MAG: iron-containing alcohol dehydrogenase [Clostridium sp.]